VGVCQEEATTVISSPTNSPLKAPLMIATWSPGVKWRWAMVRSGVTVSAGGRGGGGNEVR
jgi:hypothetical protein